MMELIDLRAISEGCDVDAVEMFGGEIMMENAAALNEVMKGTTDAIKVAFSDDAKKARQEMNLAKNAVKEKNKKAAIDHLDECIKLCKKLKEDAKEIDDDGFLSHWLTNMILGIIPWIGMIAVSVNYIISWYNLRDQSNKGNMKYSNRHENRKKNLALEYFFGNVRAAGYSRANVLAALDKMIGEAETLRAKVKDSDFDKTPEKK